MFTNNLRKGLFITIFSFLFVFVALNINNHKELNAIGSNFEFLIEGGGGSGSSSPSVTAIVIGGSSNWQLGPVDVQARCTPSGGAVITKCELINSNTGSVIKSKNTSSTSTVYTDKVTYNVLTDIKVYAKVTSSNASNNTSIDHYIRVVKDAAGPNADIPIADGTYNLYVPEGVKTNSADLPIFLGCFVLGGIGSCAGSIALAHYTSNYYYPDIINFNYDNAISDYTWQKYQTPGGSVAGEYFTKRYYLTYDYSIGGAALIMRNSFNTPGFLNREHLVGEYSIAKLNASGGISSIIANETGYIKHTATGKDHNGKGDKGYRGMYVLEPGRYTMVFKPRNTSSWPGYIGLPSSGTGSDKVSITSTRYFHFIVDKDAPTITYSLGNQTAYQKSYSPKVTITDDIAGVLESKYLVSSSITPSGTWTKFPYSSGGNVTVNSGSGVIYLHVYTIDKAGNERTARSYYYLDNNPPTISTINSGSTTYQKSYSAKLRVSDDRIGVDTNTLRYSWTTSSYTPSSASSGWSSFTNGGTVYSPSGISGKYYLHVEAKDKLGNKDNKAYLFYIDDKAPTITLTPNGNASYQKSYNVYISSTDGSNSSGVKTLKYAWSSSTTKPNSTSSAWKTIANKSNANVISPSGETGARYLHVESVDEAGNMNYFYKSFLLDNTIPTINISTATPTMYQKSHSINIQSSDLHSGLSTLRYIWSTSTTKPSSGWTSISTNANITTPAGQSGIYYLHVEAKDALGNMRDQRGTFKLDNTAPTGYVTNIQQGSQYKLNYTCGDADSGVKKCELFVDNVLQETAKTAAGTYTKTYSQPVTGTIKLVVTDNLGHTFTTYGISISNISKNAQKGIEFKTNGVHTISKNNFSLKMNNAFIAQNSISYPNASGSTISINNTQHKYYDFIYNGTYEDIVVDMTDSNGNKIYQNIGDVTINEIKETSNTANAFRNNVGHSSIQKNIQLSKPGVAGQDNYNFIMYNVKGATQGDIKITATDLENLVSAVLGSNNRIAKPLSQIYFSNSGGYVDLSVDYGHVATIFTSNEATNNQNGKTDLKVITMSGSVVVQGGVIVKLKETKFIVTDISPKTSITGSSQNTSAGLNSTFVLPTPTMYDYLGNEIEGTYKHIIKYNGIEVDKVDTSQMGIYEITTIGTDMDGNVGYPVVMNVEIKDTVAPTIKLNGEQVLTLRKGDTYVDHGGLVLDNHDKDRVIYSSDVVNTHKAGTYNVNYYSYDEAGNMSEIVTRTVIVKQNNLMNFMYLISSLTLLAISINLITKKQRS